MSVTRIEKPLNDILDETAELGNRRRAPRINRQFSIRYKMLGQTIESSVGLNVSSSGARIVLRNAPTSQLLLLAVELDNEVWVQARAVWEQPLESGHRVAGVTFESLGLKQHNALERVLSRLSQA